MRKYALQIKQSAQRELDALDDALFDDAAKVVSVTRIAHRREAYE